MENVEKYREQQSKPSPITNPEDKWKFGIHIGLKEPSQIMKAVFEVLKSLKFEWKIDYKAYKVKCRSMEYAAKIAEEIKTKEIKDKEIIMSQYYANLLKVEIKLYKVCNTNQSEDKYVLDLNKINGKMMAFIDFCSRFSKQIQEAIEKNKELSQ